MSKATNRRQAKSFSVSQRLDLQERKRDERATRNAHRKQQKDTSYLADDENFASFATQLQLVGLELRDIPGDGNCLFRAFGDQLDGHGRNHLKHRAETVQYILEHRGDFEPFVEDDVPFDKHIVNLAKSGTYAGNDSIVAFARRRSINIVIHQLNAPDWRVSGQDHPGTKELHIAYHNGDHYSSIRKYGDKSQEPTKFKSSDTSKVAAAGTKAKQRDRDGFSNHRVSSSSSNDVTGAEGGADRNGSIDEMVIQIMDATGCQDASLISDTLKDYHFDVESTIDFIMQLMHEEPDQCDDCVGVSENGLWSSGGTGARIFGGSQYGGDSEKTQPNRTQARGRGKGQRPANSRVMKQQKKAEKKERQTERHKQKLLESPEPDDDVRSTVSVPIGQMGALSI